VFYLLLDGVTGGPWLRYFNAGYTLEGDILETFMVLPVYAMVEIEKILETQRQWQAISARGETAIREMAGESLGRCAEAIEILSNNLRDIGYPWASRELISPEVLDINIAIIAGTLGLPVPPILVMFWQIIGGVSLIDLENYRHVDFWEDQDIVGPCGFCDGLYVEACSREWAAYICDDCVDWKDYYTACGSNRYLLELSPDGYHKDNISGGASNGVYPGPSWVPVWGNFEWTGRKYPVTAHGNSPDFLSYLRTTILE